MKKKKPIKKKSSEPVKKSQSFKLPITEDQLNALVHDLCKKYAFEDQDLVTAVVVNRIMHLPSDQCESTYDYFAGCVTKSMSYGVCASINSKLAHKMQIKQLEEILKANPTDQQALDALQKASDEGSESAAALLAKYERPKPNLEVVPDAG
jgi:hypothetical protein